MTTLQEAMADTKNLDKQFESVRIVAAELRKVGNLEQVTREREEAAEVAKKDTAKAEIKFDEMSEALFTADNNLRVAEGKAVAIVSDAEQKAQEVVSNAEIRAGGMVATAQSQVTGLKNKLAATEVAHDNFMRVSMAENKDMLERRDAIRNELAALEAKFKSPE